MLGVAIIGAGLIGKRRALEAARDSRTRVVCVSDPVEAARLEVAGECGAEPCASWEAALADERADIAVVATPNGLLAEISLAALAAGKHVLLEKPMGRNLAEAQAIADGARRYERVVKIGFNHRYHPAIAAAHAAFVRGEIGDAINLRTRYGHGGRPGYENEWRGNPELAGGGELTDQGVHIADLMNWFLGPPERAYALLQTAVWPLQPLEDNAFGLFHYADGRIASMHTSWTQWKNLFSFELFGTLGSLSIDGLGRSYGTETLTTAIRNPLGGVPTMTTVGFEGPDDSWQLEWGDFVGAIVDGRSYLGTPADGVAAMATIDALYRSAATGLAVSMADVPGR
jgi:predicted dehydrogenase